jgi:hypothetical protein
MFPSHRALPHQILIALRPSPSSFSFFDINHWLLWALWGCGRRAGVVQAQRQIHRALGEAAVPGAAARLRSRQASSLRRPLRVLGMLGVSL